VTITIAIAVLPFLTFHEVLQFLAKKGQPDPKVRVQMSFIDPHIF